MIDIDFYMKNHRLKKEIMNGHYSQKDKEYLFTELEKQRNKEPVVYCIGTTNKCNMRCVFCPRTKRLPKNLKTMDLETIEKIINQLKPHDDNLLKQWIEFCTKEYGVYANDMSENHFFLYIISQTLQLHLYGDPLLDKNIDKAVKLLSDKGIKSYFSCNPANIDLEKVESCFKNDLSYIKFSIESVDDKRHKELRGKKSNFTKSYEDICKLLEIKKKNNYNTIIVITMLDLNQPDQQEQYRLLKEYFEDKDVYLYLKSEDTQWYRKEFHESKAIHWREMCRQPWMCMAIDPFGNSVECMESNSSQIILGNVNDNSLYDIWNGEKYKQFRKDHFDLTPNRCVNECDMQQVGNFLK